MKLPARKHLSPANVISTLALFLALGLGTAYATHPGGANTITTGDIVDGEVRSPDLANSGIQPVDIAPNSIPSTRLADGGVQGIDIADDTVRAADIAPNAIGSGRVANDSLNGSDIQEATLGGVDAETLNGQGSDAFVQGSAHVLSNRLSIVPEGPNSTVLLDIPSIQGQVWAYCEAGTPESNPNEIQFAYFNTGDPVMVYTDRGPSNPDRVILGPSSSTFATINAQSERIIYHVGRDSDGEHDVAQITITGSGGDPCEASAQAIVHTG